MAGSSLRGGTYYSRSGAICQSEGEMRRVLVLLGAVALVAVVVIGLGQAGGESAPETPAQEFDLEAAQQQLAGAPAPLAALYGQANTILPGGT
jgi:hypothetical protein